MSRHNRKSYQVNSPAIIQAEHEPEITEIPISPDQIQDRMMRYARNPACPECAAHPVVCMMRRAGYAAFRCRECGHRWEVR